MTADIKRLLSFCQAIEESSDQSLPPIDRESLLAVHKALRILKDEIEDELSRLPFEQSVRASVPARRQHHYEN
jgi:hypothetical protein